MAAVRPAGRILAAIAPLAPMLALAACGSSTKTVSAGGPPTATAASTGAQKTASTPTSTQSKRSTTEQSTASAPSSTRTAPEPAFTEEESKSAGLGAATAVLRARGYTPANSSDYHSSQALRVLIGVRTGSGDGYGQQAFFFVNGRYIGTDASQPSAALRVVGQGDTEVTLAYPLYRSGDALCCPSRGHRQVHFQLDNGKLTALDPIPSVAERQGG
jgi:LppP/LprE lipoprotein